jgi:hypothetical protein
VERLRLVLAAQRDRYLPLRVIREQLAALERGERVLGSPPAAPRELGEARLNRDQLRQRSGLTADGVDDLERYGLLVPDAGGHFGPEALTVASIAAKLAAFGLEGRHLRPYRATADREVGLLAQLVAPLAKQGGRHGRAEALETVHELAVLCAQLHGALVRQGLRAAFGG